MKWVGLCSLLGLLVVSGCAAITPQAARGDAAAAAGNLEEADRQYAKALRVPVAGDEYEYIIERRCEVRAELASRRISALQKSGEADYPEVDAIRTYIMKCPNFGPLDARLIDVTAEILERRIAEVFTPMFERAPWQALRQFEKEAVRVPADHPVRDWSAERIAELEQKYDAVAAPYAADSPVAVTVESLKARLGEGSSEALVYDPVFRLSHPIAARAPESCPDSFDEVTVRPTADGDFDYEVRDFRILGCSREEEFENYTRVEKRTRSVTKTFTAKESYSYKCTKTTVTTIYNCSGTGAGCDTRQQRSYSDGICGGTREVERTATVSEPVMVEVPMRRRIATYTVRATATVVRGTRSEAVNIVAEAKSRGGGVSLEGGPPAGMLPAPRVPAIAPAVARAAVDRFTTTARKIRGQELAELARRAWDAGDTIEATNIWTRMWWGSMALDDTARSALAPIYHVAKLPPAPAGLPTLWVQDDPGQSVATTFESPPLDATGVLRFGFPIAHGSLGASYRQAPKGLVGQPDRSSLSLQFDGEFRGGLTTGKYGRGLGVMGGVDFSVSFGGRFGEDYERTEPLPMFASDLDREPETNRAFGLGLGALALAGGRAKRFGLFGGVRPTFTSFSIGRFLAEGASMPLVGRVEIRPRERFPILLEGHFGDLVWGNPLLGAKLDMPVSRKLWVRLRGARKTLPSVIPGLNERDRVLVEGETTTEFMIGITAMP